MTLKAFGGNSPLETLALCNSLIGFHDERLVKRRLWRLAATAGGNRSSALYLPVESASLQTC